MTAVTPTQAAPKILKKFRLLVGAHSGPKDATKHPGPGNTQHYHAECNEGLPNIVESYGDLDLIFKNKFLRIDILPEKVIVDKGAEGVVVAPRGTALPVKKAIGNPAPGSDKELEPEAQVHAFGKDVSQEFSSAKDLGMTVLEDQGLFNVFKSEDLETPLNEEGPLTAAKTKDFLKKAVKTAVTSKA